MRGDELRSHLRSPRNHVLPGLHEFLLILGSIVGVVLIGYVLIGFGVSIWALLGPDRTADGPITEPVWSGKCAATTTIRAGVSPQQAVQIAASAVGRLSSTAVERPTPHTIVGWIRYWNLSITHQLAIGLALDPDGTVRFLCCCRPRWSRTFLDPLRVCRRQSAKLAETVRQLAGPTVLGVALSH